MDTINWGIIGCGNVTERKSGPAFNKICGSKLIAVMRRDALKARDYAKRHNVGKWYDDAIKLMDDPDINAVYIATPPAFHLYYSIEALKKGLNVYVEKPVTLNAAEAQQIAKIVRETKGKLTIAHYRRALPMFLYIKDFLKNNTIGEVRTVQIRMWKNNKPDLVAKSDTNWRIDPKLSGGGYFHDLAPHQLDLMLWYFGEPERYLGFSSNQSNLSNADDQVSGQILFKNKVVVNGSWNFNVAEAEGLDVCEIIGTRGRIVFPFFGTSVYWRNEIEEQNINFIHPEHIQQPMIEKAVAYYKNEQPNPCSIDEAVSLMAIMDAFTKNS